MQLRWSHNGVSLRAQVRHWGRWRALAAGLLLGGTVLTAGLIAQLVEPAPVEDFESCLERSNRGTSLCQRIKPTYQTWNYPNGMSWVAARSRTIASGADDQWILERLRPDFGVQDQNNLMFLAMVRQQTPRKISVPLSAGQVAHARAEWVALTQIEDAYWDVRVVNRQAAAQASFDRAVVVRAFLHHIRVVWMPVLLFAWVVLLVVFRRVLRLARPLTLDVGLSGVRLDGRIIPRRSIAFLSLEGQRLRIERWTGPPVYTRPLPTEALAQADEICACLGVLGDEEETPLIAAPPRLRRLMVEGR